MINHQPRPRGWGAPPVVWALGGAIVAAQLAVMFATSDADRDALVYYFSVIPLRFDPNHAAHFRTLLEPAGPLFGHVFLHAGWLHLGMNMLLFAQTAGAPARRLAHGDPLGLRFLAVFFAAAAAGALLYVPLNAGSPTQAFGASGAACGLFAAYLLAHARDWRQAFAEPELRRSALWFLALNVGLAYMARTSGFLPIAWEAHLGGFLGGGAAYWALTRRLR